ncbi:response regulator [Thalassovita taeanensis]|uniref:CheY chemotaxis protein or a CheY-like REC (Receiver) domain n=1 Tax=Thalassovita taeanensis TaxID=657014 RepID=A0A1H9BD77_9RHOB|nr:response regulator [Thalassovita taeanensis]SEP86681.1 CheY chemotaxis protein or a CheY-like REC (receiver) domain [Thalassovita taeanensis]
MDDADLFQAARFPTPTRPLLGLTVLVVEDSRFASDAMRLLCQRSGARIRRADSLRSAERHLQVYRPSVIIVDLGLPDGDGLSLIRTLDRSVPRISVILGSSGDDLAGDSCSQAGADGFLPKPVHSLSAFQELILSCLPSDRQPMGPRSINSETIRPDPMAYKDDLAHVADLLGDGTEDRPLDYVVQFLTGIARSAADMPLVAASEALSISRMQGRGSRSDVARISGLLQERLTDSIAIGSTTQRWI